MPEKALETTTIAGKRPRISKPKQKSKRFFDVMLKNKAPGYVFKIGEARENFSLIVTEIGSDAAPSVIVGSRGKPTMMCLSYERYRPLLGRGNRTEKLALLVVEELLADSPQHIRTPAIEELSQLSLGDLERLLSIEAFPLNPKATAALKHRMENPAALDRLAKRARLSQVLHEAREAGLYDSLADALNDVVDEASQ